MAPYRQSPALPEKLHAQGAMVAEAIRDAANIVNSHIVSLSDLLRRTFRKRDSSTPLLQFSDDMAHETPGAEAPPWPGYDECGAAALELALHVNELHSIASKRLDAAEYALARLRIELAEVAPGPFGSAPERTGHRPSALVRPEASLSYVRRQGVECNGLAAA